MGRSVWAPGDEAVELPPVEVRMVTRTSDRIAEVPVAHGCVTTPVAQGVPRVVLDGVRVGG